MENALRPNDETPPRKPGAVSAPKPRLATAEEMAQAINDRYFKEMKSRYDAYLKEYDDERSAAAQQCNIWREKRIELRREINKLRGALRRATNEHERWHDAMQIKKPERLLAVERAMRRRRDLLARLAGQKKATEVRSAVREELRKLSRQTTQTTSQILCANSATSPSNTKGTL